MPLVKVQIYKGKSAEYRRAILDGIHAALVEAIKVPESDRMQSILELNPDQFERSAGRSENMTLIEIIMFKGRSLEAKKNLYKAIARNLGQSPGISGKDILIVLHEPPMEDWSLRDGLAASDTGAGFKIDV